MLAGRLSAGVPWPPVRQSPKRREIVQAHAQQIGRREAFALSRRDLVEGMPLTTDERNQLISANAEQRPAPRQFLACPYLPLADRLGRLAAVDDDAARIDRGRARAAQRLPQCPEMIGRRATCVASFAPL